MYQQANRCTVSTALDELKNFNVTLMESYCDIIDQLPTDAYEHIFGDRAKDFQNLRSLKSRVKAKISLLDKSLNRTPVPAPRPPPPPFVPHDGNISDELEEEDDLTAFLKLDEEERDSWGHSNSVSNRE